jgi:hypothetical protein
MLPGFLTPTDRTSHFDYVLHSSVMITGISRRAACGDPDRHRIQVVAGPQPWHHRKEPLFLSRPGLFPGSAEAPEMAAVRAEAGATWRARHSRPGEVANGGGNAGKDRQANRFHGGPHEAGDDVHLVSAVPPYGLTCHTLGLAGVLL